MAWWTPRRLFSDRCWGDSFCCSAAPGLPTGFPVSYGCALRDMRGDALLAPAFICPAFPRTSSRPTSCPSAGLPTRPSPTAAFLVGPEVYRTTSSSCELSGLMPRCFSSLLPVLPAPQCVALQSFSFPVFLVLLRRLYRPKWSFSLLVRFLTLCCYPRIATPG